MYINSINSYLVILAVSFGLVLGEVFGIAEIVASIYIPAVAIIFFVNDLATKQVPNFKPYFLLILFFIWASFVSVFAADSLLAYQTQKRIMLVLLYCYALISFSSKSINNLNVVLAGHVLALMAMYLNFIGGGVDLSFYENVRYDINFNANTYGYVIFGGLCSWILLCNSVQLSKNLKYAISVALIICGIYVLLIAASRGGIIVYFVVLLFWFFSERVKLQSSKASLYLFFGLIAFIYLVLSASEFDFSSIYLYQRFSSMSDEESIRGLHLMEAINVGYNNIIFGVGGGNYSIQPRHFEPGIFSHNGFAEAFANYGLIGFLLYASLMIEYINKLYAFYNITKKTSLILVHTGFVIGFVVYNMFYVPYVTLEFMGVFSVFRINLEYGINGVAYEK